MRKIWSFEVAGAFGTVVATKAPKELGGFLKEKSVLNVPQRNSTKRACQRSQRVLWRGVVSLSTPKCLS